MTETTTDRPAHGWAPMLFIGLGVALIIMDATVVTVILPSIIADLGINSVDAEWVNAVYSLTFAALLIVMGRLGDRYGRRRIFILGAIAFGLSSVVAAAATSGGVLITARALQGIGGAMMSPTSLSLVNALYRGKARNIAFALYGSIIGGMAAIGPLVGGWVTEAVSWHWAFWVNIPVSLIIIVGSIRVVPESLAEGDVGKADVIGAVLSAVGIAALVFALIEGRNYGWWLTNADSRLLGRTWTAGGISPVALAMGVAVVSLAGLLRYESHRLSRGQSVLLDVTLFRIRTFGLGSFAGLIVSLGEFGLLFSLPLFLQSVLGWSALGAGGLLATLAMGAFVAAPTAAQLASRRNPRFVTRLGLALEVVGIAGIAVTVSPTASGWVLGGWLFVYGMGVGYASAQLTGLILADVPVAKSGQASGTQSTARQIGAAMGTAVLGTVVFVSLHANVARQLRDIPGMTADMAEQVATAVEKSAGTIIPSLAQRGGEPVLVAAQQAFADAVRTTGVVAAAFVVLGLLATWALPPGDSHNSADESQLIHDFE